MRKHGGFTIVEVLVALLILNVGLLSLASTAAVVTRMLGQSRAAAMAAGLAHARLEVVRQTGCAATGGIETRNGLNVRWEVSAPAFPRARLVRVLVEPPDGRGPHDSLSTYLFCP